MKRLDLIGKKFGRLEVIDFDSLENKWLCRCDCGNTNKVITSSLNRGNTRSCGCLLKETTKITHSKHGMYNSKVYHVWNSMVQRCINPENQSYENYGGRGITVCEDWLVFENFYRDMGEPNGLTIERKNNNLGYSKDNCIWTTRQVQNKNHRRVRNITFNGVTKTATDWAKEIGVSDQCIYSRLDRGLTTEQVLERQKYKRVK